MENKFAGTGSSEEYINFTLELNEKMMNALTSEIGLFRPDTIKQDIVLLDKKGNRIVIDAIAEVSESGSCIIETRCLIHKSILYKWVSQVRNCLNIYKKNLKVTHTSQKVKCILLVPDSPSFEDDFSNGIAILKYSFDKKEFINKQEIQKWIKKG